MGNVGGERSPEIRDALASTGSIALVLSFCLALFWLIAFVLRIASRPPQFANEAEMLYEASRVARRLPLYTNPIAGAWDDGPLPIRHYVLYGPIGPAILALIPQSFRLEGARWLSVGAWFVGVPLVVWRVRRPMHWAGAVVALSYASLYLISRDVISFTLTPLPVLIALIALARIVRLDRLDVVSMLLLVLAAAIKPVVIGTMIGVVLAQALDTRRPPRQRARPIAILGAIGFAAVAALLIATRGAWFMHLRASTDNGFIPAHYLNYFLTQFVILGLPNIIVLVIQNRALAAGVGRHRWTFFALAASTAWIIFAIGKRGSNAGYFMEPAAVLALSIALFDEPENLLPARLVGGALIAAPIVSLLASREAVLPLFAGSADEDWHEIVEIRRVCDQDAQARGLDEAQIRSSITEMEYALTRRVTLAPWQTTMLLRRGKFPIEPLLADLDNPALTCIVHPRALAGPLPPEVNPDGELHYFEVLYDRRLREAINARFEDFAQVGKWHLFRRK